MTTQTSSLTRLEKETLEVQAPEEETQLGYGAAARKGALLCILLAVAYTTVFILYATVRSSLTAATIVNPDAGVMGTLIATWSSLVVAALVIGLLLSAAVAILGAFAGILIRAISGILNPHNAPRQQSIIGMGVCFAIVVLLHLALRSAISFSLPDLLSMHALFWLELPSMIFIIVAGNFHRIEGLI